MKVFCFCLIFLFFVSLGIYIYACIKNKLSLQKLSSLFFLPLSCLPIIISLNNYLPDSAHIRFLSIFTLIFILASNICFYVEKKITKYLSEVFFAINIFMWIQLYKTTFYIFKYNTSSIIALFLFFSLLLFLLLVYTRRQNNIFILIRILIFYSLVFLNFSAIITAKNINKNAYTFTFLLGSLLLIIYYILYCIQSARPNQEIKSSVIHIVRTILFNSSQFLIMLTGLLMIN